jgi:hypothetical protein
VSFQSEAFSLQSSPPDFGKGRLGFFSISGLSPLKFNEVSLADNLEGRVESPMGTPQEKNEDFAGT